jgi:hypothetical protein
MTEENINEGVFAKITPKDRILLNIIASRSLGFNGFELSNLAEISNSHTLFRLRVLISLGIVKKSIKHKYYILPTTKQELIKNGIITGV